MRCTVPLSGANAQAGAASPSKGKIRIRLIEPVVRPRRLTPIRRENFMASDDAVVLAKFVFVVFGLGLTGMVAQLIMLG
jgi:hypothetical protein